MTTRSAHCGAPSPIGRSPDYASASLGWDELFLRYPLVIVFAQETKDVVNALTWARQHDVALRVRSGRHSLEGWSNVDNGIVIDVSELKSARIDKAARTATVGAGLNQLEAVTALGKMGLAVTTGTEGSVGLAGATLGGGFGFLTRYLGMACDALIGAEIVVTSGADGATAINVDANNCSDLLWALRGAGNGNFGIVTSFTFDIYAAFQVPTEDDPANWKFFSQFTSEPFPREAISLIGSFMQHAPTDDSNFFTQAFGGAVTTSEPAGGTAFPHRGALFYSEPGAGWGKRGKPGSGDAITPKAQAWIAEFSQALRPYVNGAYVNVPNIGMAEWETAYWGTNFGRLRQIKAKYDPGNVFQYEQSIPPA
jgi:FAD/FMN-containing dehydrogenase